MKKILHVVFFVPRRFLDEGGGACAIRVCLWDVSRVLLETIYSFNDEH